MAPLILFLPLKAKHCSKARDFIGVCEKLIGQAYILGEIPVRSNENVVMPRSHLFGAGYYAKQKEISNVFYRA